MGVMDVMHGLGIMGNIGVMGNMGDANYAFCIMNSAL
jgi:hypothetical protein